MTYDILMLDEVDDDFLTSFERLQVTKAIYALNESGHLKVKAEAYTEVWDAQKKKQVIEILRYYLDLGGAVIAINERDHLLGFAGINGKPMGSSGQYLNLGYIHVTHSHRGMGLGKVLFDKCCGLAMARGVKKLYIGANPSVDTYHFYASVGCRLAEEHVKEIVDQEPLDLQLEYDLQQRRDEKEFKDASC